MTGQQIKQQGRVSGWETLAHDVKYTLRGLRRSPGFTAVAALTLALGIGANGAIFSLLDRLTLRAPPGIAKAEDVWRLRQRMIPPTVRQPFNRYDVGALEFQAIRAAVPASTAIAGYWIDHPLLGRPDAPTQGNRSYVSGDYFSVLGVRPAAGRFFDGDESRIETATPVAVISHALWVNQYGRESSVLGSLLEIESRPYTIIGVAPPAFVGVDVDAVDVRVPMNTSTAIGFDGLPWYAAERSRVRIRLIARAAAVDLVNRITANAATVIRSTEGYREATISLEPVRHSPLANDKQMATSARLAGVTAIILLIACANVANLLLVRGVQRRREIAIRLALGINRKRLVRQLLTESLVIAALGAAVAFVVAVWGADLLRHGLLPDVRWGDRGVDPRLALFIAVTALLAGLGAGLLSAAIVSRPDLTSALKEGEREGTFQWSGLRSALLVAQVALSLVLVAGAGLFVRSMQNVEAVDMGFDADRLIGAMAWTAKPHLGSRAADIGIRIRELAPAIERLPGVEGVSLSTTVPMLSEVAGMKLFLANGDSVLKIGEVPPFRTAVAPEYFDAMGMRVQAGRVFQPSDRLGSERVVVVNATMSKTIWPGQNAVDQCLIVGARDAPCVRVIGVVADGHWRAIVEGPAMQFYIPLEQQPDPNALAALMIRSAPGRAAAVADQVRSMFTSAFGDWADSRVATLGERMANELRPWRVSAALFSMAGLLALLVAAVGVYGTIAYTVRQRIHEMGVRMALGASGRDILKLVIGGGVRLVVVGIVIGASATLALSRFVAFELYGVAPTDPVVLVAGALVLLTVAVAACLIPAWRATRADPVSSLKVG